MVIETEALTKYYGEKVGCRDVSLAIRGSEIFGFLGPNGAGKSTFVKMLVGLLRPSSGSASILGRPAGDWRVRRKIGYLPENFKYQDWMTGVDLLSFHASLCKLNSRTFKARMEDVLEIAGLKGHEKYTVGTYSKGMQQRIGIACALIADPELIFFDEPTSALDPIGRKEVREIMLEMKRRGKTVFLNSHMLSEVEMICDSIAVINKGSIVQYGKVEQLLGSSYSLDICAEGLTPGILLRLKAIDPELEEHRDTLRMKLTSREDIHAIAATILENGGRLYALTPHRESLESLFINLVQGGEHG